MSQSNLGKLQYPADAFFQLTVASTANYTVGEKITGATTGATAKISGIINGTTLRIKGMKPGASYNFCGANGATAENITGSIYSTPVNCSALTLANSLRRMNSSGTVVATTDNTYALNDSGFTVTSRNAHMGKMVGTAIRFGQSKYQAASDTATTPVWTIAIPTSGNYSKAGLSKLRFQFAASESVTVVGSPRIAITFAAAGQQIVAGGITSINGNGTTATATTGAAHNLRTGQVVAVAGMTTAGFNNATATVTVTGTNTFTYANATSGACTIGTGTITLNALQYGFYTSGSSTSQNLVFDYTCSGAEANGALVSIAYNANGATITDVGGGATTPTWNPTVTGIVIVA